MINESARNKEARLRIHGWSWKKTLVCAGELGQERHEDPCWRCSSRWASPLAPLVAHPGPPIDW